MAVEWIAPAIAGTAEATTGIFGALAGMRNTDQANAINAQYANLNYQHQLEREKIEDQRYAEETAYNREKAEKEQAYQHSFAENERAYQRQWAQEQRDYNRALQQQIFEREDTAISRQANELSKLGINPLSANMNGLGAGSVVSSTSSGASSAPISSMPSSSSRGNSSPAQINYQQQLYDFSNIINAISSVAQGVDGAITGQYQRDALALQNDAQFLANLEKANDLGIAYNAPNRMRKTPRYPNAFIEFKGDYSPFVDSRGWKSFKNIQSKKSDKHSLFLYI